MKENKFSVMQFLAKVVQGALVGLGAVLPGISGGVLCVVFGIYKIIMEFLADPIRKFKTHFPKLIPVGIGGVIGFIGIAKLLEKLLDAYPEPSVCLFIGLIVGMLPSIFREAGEQGRDKKSYISMVIAMILISALLLSLAAANVVIVPYFAWYVFCGFCLALSVIAPGMSFSTLLMPLGLYEPFIGGIGNLDFSILIPGGIGALATVILFAKAVDTLFKKHYSVAFHAIVGIVIAATAMLIIIPQEDLKIIQSFTTSAASAISNIVCLVFGVVAALLLDKFDQKFAVE